ncbi:hypothetical protein BU090_02270 [Staphylococcus warneri]|uniref:hypothetical protein n=1 Tax=Staphylococcus warneri TaxID=1292 RepID=UPI000D1D1F8A|nr:hypothetical protein [Staphylococcus warneri]PTI61385.1 hypothetical protein BU090_02270 [Staphylococcus warneri]
MYKKIFLLFMISLMCIVLSSCGTADKKVNGEWKYEYAKYNALKFKSNSDGMFVEGEGVQIQVRPLQGANDKNFDFLFQADHDKNYVFHVEIIDKNHITITPESEKKYSLAKVFVGSKNLSEKAEKESAIKLKKVK